MPSGTISGDQERKFCTRPTFTAGRGCRSSCRGTGRLVHHQRDGEEVAVAQLARVQQRDRLSATICAHQLAHRRRADDMARGVGLALAVRVATLDAPELAGPRHRRARRSSRPISTWPPRARILRRGGVPHHAGALARIAEALDQRLDDVAALGARPSACARASASARSMTARRRSRPLMRCAAQSAEISSQDMPHTFSV